MEALLVETPIGLLLGATDGGVLSALRFWDGAPPADASSAHPAADRLRCYFDGDLEALRAIDYRAEGTDFQTEVWAEVARVPAGQTASYADIANHIGRPKAVRAVGAANGKNPISLIIPCHRIVGASGDLTGYAWGVWRKRWLLVHEGAPVSDQQDLLASVGTEPGPDEIVI